MSTRLRTVIIAVIFGLLGTIGTAMYINSVRGALIESGTKRPVLVAATTIEAGAPLADIIGRGDVSKVDMPKRYAAEDAVGDAKGIGGRILVSRLGRGEQVTRQKLRPADLSDAAYRLPPDKVAISIPVDDVTGVGDQIKAGNRILVLATFTPGPGGADITRILLSDIEVLASTGGGSGRAGMAPQKRTMTLAMSPVEAEKLVFAQERGKVWTALASASSQAPAPTSGQTMESVFK